jgi:hypothetical protein
MRYDYITESGKTITQDTRDVWPTRAFTATGQGVTVHKSTGRLFVATGEDEIVPLVRRTAPVRNIIEAAARCDDLFLAMRTISDALELERLRLAEANLSNAARWRRLPHSARLKEIAGWLTAECFELMDLIEVDHVNTIGD